SVSGGRSNVWQATLAAPPEVLVSDLGMFFHIELVASEHKVSERIRAAPATGTMRSTWPPGRDGGLQWRPSLGAALSRTFVRPAQKARKEHQTRRRLSTHAADPRGPRHPEIGSDATTGRSRTRAAAGLGTRCAAAPGSQQGRGGGRQQA